MRRFWHANDGGGTDGGAGSQTDATPPADGGTPPADGGTPPADGHTSTPEPQGKPEDFDYKSEYAKLEATSKELAEQHEQLKSKVGKQANEVGAYKKFVSRMNEDPKGLIEEIAKNSNVKIQYPESSPDLSKVFDEHGDIHLTQDNFKSLINDIKSQAVSEAKLELAPQYDKIFTEQLRSKYEDFDNLEEDRAMLQTQVLSKELTYAELMHLAARGLNMADALNTAGAKAVEKYKEELAAKTAGQIAGPGAAQPNADKPDNKEYFGKVVSEMKKVRR